MKMTYYSSRSIRCRVPAPSVGFGEGGRMVFARQFPGKGTSRGEETRRSRKTALVVRYQLSVVRGLSCPH